MNRKERRRQQKQAERTGAANRLAPPPRTAQVGGVSDLLLRHAGQYAAPRIDPAALEIVAARAATGPIDAALAKLRRADLLRQQVAAVEAALAGDPRSVELLLTLAKLHRHLDQPEAALAAYRRVLDIDPSRQDVPHMIAALGGGGTAGQVPDRAADAYVTEEFDGFAARYDDVLVGWLEYKGPAIVHQATLAVLGDNPPPQDIIDLGCGTGLNAPLFRKLARRLHGVDLSPRMIEKARARGLYDELVVAEIIRFLAETPRRYTLALASDVLIYFGDLVPVLQHVHAALQPGGVFVFTLETGAEPPYRLTPSGRYAHDDGYVQASAAEVGFAVARATDETVRKEKLQPVKSRCYALKKPDA